MSTELPDKLLNIDGERGDDRDPEPDGNNDETEERERFVVFRIGDSEYGLEVDRVLSVVEETEYTRLPRTSEAIEGLIDLRGSITAVIDPRIYLGTGGQSARAGEQRIVVLDRPGDRQDVGLQVDEVLGVEAVPVSSIFHKPSASDDIDATALSHALIRAIVAPDEEGDRQVSLIDLDGLVQAAGNGR